MHNLSRRRLLGLMGMAPLAGGILGTSASGASGAAKMLADSRASGGADMLAESRAARERIRKRYFPDVMLRTQDDRQVRFYDELVKDKIVTINFFYANCEGICPLVTSNLVKVQK